MLCAACGGHITSVCVGVMAANQTRCWGVSVVVVVVVMVVLGHLVPGGAAQRTQECETTPSTTPGKMDVYCNCMQRLTKVDVEVAQLTFNQTGCAQVGLELRWSTLEAEVAPSTLVLVGTRVYFAKSGDVTAWQPSITAIHFINCSFVEVPGHAFQDLQLLEEVRLVGGAAAVVQRGAFSGLPRLRVVEAVNASVGVLETGAWANLPAIKDIALVHCSVGEVQTLAFNLSSTSYAEEGEECSSTRTLDRSRVLEVLSARQRNTNVANLSLPDYGSQLLLFKNSIELMRSRAFSGNAFGFFIMGSNAVGHIAPFALDLELHNPCEISAALLVANQLTRLEDKALAGLRSKSGAARRTFLALTNNTWSSVAPHAFTLHHDIAMFSAGENHFRCRCDALQWTTTEATTTPERDLQEALQAESVCEDGTTLAAFTLACHNPPSLPSPSIIPPPPPIHTTRPRPRPIVTPSPILTTSLPSSSHPSTTPTTTLTPETPSPSNAPHSALTPATFLTLLVARALL